MAGRQLASFIREDLGRMAVKNGSGRTDDTLLQRFISQADEAAFETLMWRHEPMVLATCRRMLANSHDAQDAFQDTFLVLSRKAGSIQKGVSLGSWLYKVAYRICRHTQAQAPRHPRHGKWVAVGGQEAVVILYDLGTGKEFKRLTGLPGATSALAFSADSRTIAWGGWYGGPVVLWEIATNQQRRRFSGHLGRIHSLVFSPSGKFLASGSEDTAALLWDVAASTRLTRKRASPSEHNLDRCWSHLASEDAAVAYEALCELVAIGDRAVPFLATHLKPVSAVSLDEVRNLIADPDSDDFGVRERAA